MNKVGIVRFLGTNCDRDIWQAVETAQKKPEWMWYQDQYESDKWEAIILPGGFSYGDNLRCGALAAKAPVMNTLREAAQRGTPILGICNGFQILCEAGLLPGLLIENKNGLFIDKWVDLNLSKASPYWGEALRRTFVCLLPMGRVGFLSPPMG